MAEDRRALLPTVSNPGTPLRVRLATISRCLVLLTIIAVTVVCYLASDVLTDIALALLLSLLLSPIATSLERLRLPRALASAIVVFIALGCAVGAGFALAQPMRDWVTKAPTAVQAVRHRMQAFESSVAKATRGAVVIGDVPASRAAVDAPAMAAVPQFLRDVVAGTPHALATVASIVLLLYFFLSSGDNFLRRLVEVAPRMMAKRTVVVIARDIQYEMSRYLVTITFINLGLGIATTSMCALLSVPNALLWGAMAFLLNFAPYVGAAITAIVLCIVGLSSFDSISHALAVPAAFLVLAVIEGQLVTPTVIGRRHAVNPVVVFVWLLALGALWGISGLLLAGPLLACLRIVCQHTAALRPLYVLIGEVKIEDGD